MLTSLNVECLNVGDYPFTDSDHHGDKLMTSKSQTGVCMRVSVRSDIMRTDVLKHDLLV